MFNLIESVSFFILGIVSGMPLALTGGTFSMRLVDLGTTKETIGVLGMLGIGYSVKFLYAPLLDYFRAPVLRRLFMKRADWMILFVITCSCGMLICSTVVDKNQLFLLGSGALLIGFSSAAFDIVCDGFRVSSVAKDRQGFIAALFVYGYRTGMMISSAFALYIADKFSWKESYLMMFIIYISCALVSVIIANKLYKNINIEEKNDENLKILQYIRDIFVVPLVSLFEKKHIVAFLCMVTLFKLTDIYVGSMTNPFLTDLGFTKTDIAAIVKLFGFFATLAGVGTGGYLTMKFSPEKVVLGSIIMQIFANALFGMQYYFGNDKLALSILMSIENFSSAISNTVLVFLLSRACNIKFSGTQYALMTSGIAFSRTMLGTGSGFLANFVGWKWFFVCAGGLEVPSLLIAIHLMRKKVF